MSARWIQIAEIAGDDHIATSHVERLLTNAGYAVDWTGAKLWRLAIWTEPSEVVRIEKLLLIDAWQHSYELSFVHSNVRVALSAKSWISVNVEQPAELWMTNNTDTLPENVKAVLKCPEFEAIDLSKLVIEKIRFCQRKMLTILGREEDAYDVELLVSENGVSTYEMHFQVLPTPLQVKFLGGGSPRRRK